MAITTRWRMPPDSSCGYWARRRSGSGMRTSRRSSSARARAASSAEPLVQHQPVGQLPLDGEDRVERGHRLLEDHPDLAAADVAHGWRRRPRPRRARSRPRGRSGSRPPVMRPPPNSTSRMMRERGDGLARAAFAHDADGLAGRDGEAHVLHPRDGAAVACEFDAEVSTVTMGCGHFFALGSSTSRRTSPNMLRPSTVIATARPGTSAVHGATVEVVAARLDHQAPGGRRRLRAEAEEGQPRFGQDREGEADRRLHDHGGHDVRQHVAHHHLQVAWCPPARAAST